MAPHGQVRLQQDAEVTHKGRGPYQGPQTLSSPVSRWMHRLRVVHHKKSIFSGLSRSLLERIHSTQHQAPYDAAAVELLMEGPRVKLRVIGRAPQEVHLLGVESQSVGTHPFHSTPSSIRRRCCGTVDGGPTCKAESHRSCTTRSPSSRG